MAIPQGKIIDSAVSEAVQKKVDAMSLDEFDVADPALYQNNTIWPYFERLRNEDPVHYCKNSEFGPYWSITKYKDIIAAELNTEVFSSDTANGGITINDGNLGLDVEMFIAMDNPEHEQQRKTVSPMMSPENLKLIEGTIRERSRKVLRELPIGKPFDWVELVSVELTTLMLATLFGFPLEDRKKLTHWSDVASTMPGADDYVSPEYIMQELAECAAYFTGMWNERVNSEPRPDLISMMAHADATRDMSPNQFLGNLVLLIVGGNDTTRNSMTGSILALNQNPDEYKKLCANPKLVASMVPEVIRWQTPLPAMRRTAVSDIEFGGKQIRKGDKVMMWYISGNRDPEAIENPDEFIIDRRRPRQHLSFGFGVHRCVGNRLAEMQVRVLWEEILNLWPEPCIEVVGEPERGYSCILRSFTKLLVQINPK
ncbi:MAG: cytochrome P450 [Piscirickettsiaceae bacterium]|nr:MAG: cytochrome P450 [Piscirickettsiaceae bacterium]PCI67503.1 MAG: cytochrome P450 [Piscirickettsiaceae bacterium]